MGEPETIWDLGRAAYAEHVTGEADADKAAAALFGALAATCPGIAGPARTGLRYGADYVIRSLLNQERERAQREANARMAAGAHVPPRPTPEALRQLAADLRPLTATLLTAWRLASGTPIGDATPAQLRESVSRRRAQTLGNMVGLLFEEKVLAVCKGSRLVRKQLNAARLDRLMAEAEAEAASWGAGESGKRAS